MPVRLKTMCAKKLDGFQTSNSSFWRQSSGAIPGRVNQTKSSGFGAAAHSFQDFQESVSDAWDIEEPITPTSAPAKESKEGTVSKEKDGITPTHSLSQVLVK